MSELFHLDKPFYTPRELAQLFTRHIYHVSYPTVLGWIELARNTGGSEGVNAGRTPKGRYYVPANEVRRILRQAGATEKEPAS